MSYGPLVITGIRGPLCRIFGRFFQAKPLGRDDSGKGQNLGLGPGGLNLLQPELSPQMVVEK